MWDRAQGNIILCDHEMTILTLLRSHRDDLKGLQIMPRHPYPTARSRIPTTHAQTHASKLNQTHTQMHAQAHI